MSWALAGQAAVLQPSHHKQLLSWVHWCHSVQRVLPPGLRQHWVLSDLGMLPSSSNTASVPLSHPGEGSVIWGMATHFRHLSPGGWRVG